MPSVHETAYPRLKQTLSSRELEDTYTPSHEEVALVDKVARNEVIRLGFVVLLKAFQRLGYFVQLQAVPTVLVEYIAHCLGHLFVPQRLHTYDTSGTRGEHLQVIRQHLNVQVFDDQGKAVMQQAIHTAAQTREDLRDLITAGIEALTLNRYELPGFTTLERAARQIRREVNDTLIEGVAAALSDEDKTKLDDLFDQPGIEKGTTLWNRVKQDAGKANLTEFKLQITHRQWLLTICPKVEVQKMLPDSKLRQFALEAHSLDASQMRNLSTPKRYTLAAALLHVQAAKVLDDLGDLFVKRMVAIHHKGKEALERYRRDHQSLTDSLIKTLQDTLLAYQTEGNDSQRLQAISGVLGRPERIKQLLDRCEEHEAYAQNNYFPFLLSHFASHRSTFLRLCKILPLKATTQEGSFQQALDLIQRHEQRKGTWIELEQEEKPDLSWVSEAWWRLITGYTRKDRYPQRLNRRQFEVCVFTRMLWDLKSGDACIEGSLEYADYRTQLVSDQEYGQLVEGFCTEVELPSSAEAFVAGLQAALETTAQQTDATIAGSDSIRIENGVPVLKKNPRKPDPPNLRWLEYQIKQRLPVVPILDVLVDTEKLLDWTRFFGPLSGYETKLENPIGRYLTTVFC